MNKNQAMPYVVSLLFGANSVLAAIDSAVPIDAPVLAVDDPIRFHAGYSVARDSNLLRVSDDVAEEESDTLHRLEAGVELKLNLARQLATIRLDASRNEFERFSELDHDGRDLLGRLDWQIGNRLRGDVGYTNTRTLNTLVELQSPIRDQLTQQRGFASARYFLDPNWSVSSGLEHYELEHSANVNEVFDRREDSIYLNLYYLNVAKNQIGLQFKAINGELPEREFQPGIFVDNDYRQFELNAIADWYLTGKTLLQGGMGYTRRNYRELGDRDFDGVAGRLTLNWLPTGKIQVAFTGRREITAVEDFSATHAIVTGLTVAPVWTPTAKIRVEGGFYYEERDFEGEVASSNERRSDEVHGANLTLSYMPREKIRLALLAKTENRDSNRVFRDYRYEIVGISVRIEFY